MKVKGILKLLILKELEKSDATGYELIQKIGTRMKKPSPGSVYPLLKELASAGFLSMRVEGKKKIYSLSEKGKAILEEMSKQEEKAILKKIEVLKTSRIIGEEDADKLIDFITMKKKLWIGLFRLRNWEKFITLIAKHAERSKAEVEKVIDEAIEKLEKFKD